MSMLVGMEVEQLDWLRTVALCTSGGQAVAAVLERV